MNPPIAKKKRCNACRKTKRASGFGWRKGKADHFYLRPYCNACVRAYGARDRAARKAERAATEKKYKDSKRGSIRAAASAYYERNKERISERRRRYRRENRERVAPQEIAYTAKRRSLGYHTASPLNVEAISATLAAYKIGGQYWDVYGSELIDEPQIDHIVPLSAGGSNESENLCITSKSHNSAKARMPLIVFLARKAAINEAKKRRAGVPSESG